MSAEITSLAQLPFHTSGRFPNSVIRRCRADGFTDLTSREFFERIRDLSLGLQACGVRAGDRVAVLAESRPEWSVADLAILACGAVTVPIYPTLSSTQVGYILADSGARAVIVSTPEQADKVVSAGANGGDISLVAIMDPGGPLETTPGGTPPDSRLTSLAELTTRGHRRLMSEAGLARAFREACDEVEASSLATIIYTSGTTGEPKGVMLTHANLLANLVATEAIIPMSEEDVALSFLPLSHSFERLVLYKYLYRGVSVAFAESVETIGRDLQAVRPTIMTGVPRVFEKLRARVLESVAAAPRLRRAMFDWAVGVGRRRAAAELAGRAVPGWVAAQSRVAERLVFAKIRARTGGNLRLVVSGSAPLAPTVAEFFFAIGLPITEGYGLTETSPVLTVNPPEAPRLGTVGRAIPGVEIRIADDGEILARGPNLMAGYHGKPDATQEVIRDGWLHTGDVGHLDADGYLTITDRKKDLIVTSGGKNIAPQPIEARLKQHPLVAEAVVLGDKRRFVSALLVPDATALAAAMGRPSESADDLATVIDRPEVQSLFQTVVDEVNADLAQYETIKRFTLVAAQFSVEGGELTPTLKVRRRVVAERWGKLIDQMYA